MIGTFCNWKTNLTLLASFKRRKKKQKTNFWTFFSLSYHQLSLLLVHFLCWLIFSKTGFFFWQDNMHSTVLIFGALHQAFGKKVWLHNILFCTWILHNQDSYENDLPDMKYWYVWLCFLKRCILCQLLILWVSQIVSVLDFVDLIIYLPYFG